MARGYRSPAAGDRTPPSGAPVSGTPVQTVLRFSPPDRAEHAGRIAFLGPENARRRKLVGSLVPLAVVVLGIVVNLARGPAKAASTWRQTRDGPAATGQDPDGTEFDAPRTILATDGPRRQGRVAAAVLRIGGVETTTAVPFERALPDPAVGSGTSVSLQAGARRRRRDAHPGAGHGAAGADRDPLDPLGYAGEVPRQPTPFWSFVTGGSPGTPAGEVLAGHRPLVDGGVAAFFDLDLR